MPQEKLDLTNPEQLERYLGLHDEAAEKKAAEKLLPALNAITEDAKRSDEKYSHSALLSLSITNTQPKNTLSTDSATEKTANIKKPTPK